MLKAMCIAGTWYFPHFTLQVKGDTFPAYDEPNGGYDSGTLWNDDSTSYGGVPVLGCCVYGTNIWLHVKGSSDVHQSDYRYVKLDDVLQNPNMKITIKSGLFPT